MFSFTTMTISFLAGNKIELIYNELTTLKTNKIKLKNKLNLKNFFR